MTNYLTDIEKERYARHLVLPHFGEVAQLKLKNTKVLVIGAGGLGSPVLQYLAAAGVGKIGIVDTDVVSLSNLQRQILYRTNEIGQKKIEMAKKHLNLLNPEVSYEIYDLRFNYNNAEELVKQYDIIVDCPDNYETRYVTSHACSAADKPHVFGSIFQYEGQVSVFNYQNGATYKDLFPENPQINEKDESLIGVIGVLPGIVGSIQAAEVIKIATGIGDVLSNKLLIFSVLTMQFQILKIKKTNRLP